MDILKKEDRYTRNYLGAIIILVFTTFAFSIVAQDNTLVGCAYVSEPYKQRKIRIIIKDDSFHFGNDITSRLSLYKRFGNRFYSNLKKPSCIFPGNIADPVKIFHKNKLVATSYLSFEIGLDGYSKEFYPNGTIKSEGVYVNNYKTGLFKYYDESGMLAKTQFYESNYLFCLGLHLRYLVLE